MISDLSNEDAAVFLNLSEATYSDYIEAGLLGIAFHPDYQDNGELFVYRTVAEMADGRRMLYNRLSRFKVFQQDPDVVDPTYEIIILSQLDPDKEHSKRHAEHHYPSGS